jgi:transposase
MAHLSGHDRSQLLLLPGAVDDYVGPDNPVRFIEAFVDELDPAAAGFARVVPKATGRSLDIRNVSGDEEPRAS